MAKKERDASIGKIIDKINGKIIDKILQASCKFNGKIIGKILQLLVIVAAYAATNIYHPPPNL